MADSSIVNPAVSSAPKDYTLPSTNELLLKAVRASVDGTGAGGAFLPALQLLDPAGNVMWTATTSSSVVAGGSADVSWFPGLSGSSSSGSSVSNAWAAMSKNVASFADTTGSPYVTVDLAAGSLITSDTSIFSVGTSGGNHGLQINAAGSYLIWVAAQANPTVAPAAGAALGVGLGSPGGVLNAGLVEISPFTSRPDVALTTQANSTQTYTVLMPGDDPVGTVFTLLAGQSSGGAVSLTASVFAQQLNTFHL